MAPKVPKPKTRPVADKAEEALTAVVIADSFESAFKPLTKAKPRCLLPLANIPLIEYTFEFLAQNAVQQVLVYGGNHADQLERYLESSRWKSPSSPFASLDILKATASSVGDCMRDLDNRDLVSGDFIVVSGDVVANVDLAPVLARHKARKEQDKNAIMTMVLQANPNKPHCVRRRRTRRPVFVLEPRADRCLHYEEIDKRAKSHYISLDPEFVTAHAEISVRDDLVDPYIDICTPDVLALWSENFDYQSLRSSFLFGVLKDYELNGKTIHTHIIGKEQYAARARNWSCYRDISRDILSLRIPPLRLDHNLMDDQTYRRSAKGHYLENSTQITRRAQILGLAAIGQKTKIGNDTIIDSSIIGRQCTIGDNVHIQDAIIWGKVNIADNVTITGPTVIADGVTLAAHSKILPGSIINFHTKVETSAEVSGKTTNSESALHAETTTPEQGRGESIVTHSDSDSSVASSAQLFYQKPKANSSASSISTFASSNPSLSSYGADQDILDSNFMSERRGSGISQASTLESNPDYDQIHANRRFQAEAAESILDGLTEGHAADTIFLELNSLRMMEDVSQSQVRQAVVSALMQHIRHLVYPKTTTKSNLSIREAISKTVEQYHTLLDRIILDKDAPSDEKHDQVDLLLLLQKDALANWSHDGPSSSSAGGQALLFMTKECYDQDLIEEDGILAWWDDARSGGDAKASDGMKSVRNLTEQFVTFLREADEEEDESDED